MSNGRWVEPEYSRKQINRAGNVLRDPNASPIEKKEAMVVVNNWRESHAYPLQIIYVHLRRMREDSKIIVAQRLKRMESISRKLELQPKMELWRVHDLGGCRFVVDSVQEVYRYIEKLKRSRIRHLFVREYDYISQPKESGYRSYHIVLQYKSDKKAKEVYNRNMLIELQFRTRLQHIWATAVETMGIITKQELKSSIGDEDVKRFFVLVSSVFALYEGYPVVPNTSDSYDVLREEIIDINNRNHIIERLRAYRLVTRFNKREFEQKGKKDDGYYLLNLTFDKQELSVVKFKSNAIDQANERYTYLEKQLDNNHDVVLVRSTSFSDVRKAYPNYFNDIREFVKIVQEFIDAK